MGTTMIYLLVAVLTYKALMPIIAWIVPTSKMEAAAKYIEQTERRFRTQEILKVFRKSKEVKKETKGNGKNKGKKNSK